MKNIINRLAIFILFCFLFSTMSNCRSRQSKVKERDLIYKSKLQTHKKVQIHLFGGDVSPNAPLAQWYHDIGITDVWLYPVKGVFPQDQPLESQKSIGDLENLNILKSYRDNHLRYWWLERPVPDYLYAKYQDNSNTNIWDNSLKSNTVWNEICANITKVYPAVDGADFSGLVYDNEAYYSYGMSTKQWVWGGHEAQYGSDGNYYKRGLQVGKAIKTTWPDAKIIMVYAFGYKGEYWWYKGFQDAGLDLYLGIEHSYGAGPKTDDEQWYQYWWKGRNTKETCDWKRTQFPFIQNNQHIIAGLFPIIFGDYTVNYSAKYFRQQLESAAYDDPKGSISVWLWPQGTFNPERWDKVNYLEGETAHDYLHILKEFSEAFSP